MKFSTVKDLKDQRALKYQEADQLIATAEKEQRDLTDDENTQFETLTSEIEALDKRIGQQTKVEAFKNARNADMGNGQDELSEKDKRDLSKFSVFRALSLMSEGKAIDGVESEVGKLGEDSARRNGITPTTGSFYVPAEYLSKRGQTVTLQTTNPGDQGGVTVPTDLNALVDVLWSRTFLAQVGARFIRGLHGDQRFPRQISKPTVSALTEIEEMGYTEIRFDDFEMKPNRRGATIPIAKQLLLQSSLDAQALVIDNIALAIAQYMNVEAVTKLLSILTTANGNLVELGTDGADLTYEKLVEIESLVDNKDALLGNISWLTNSKVKAKLRTEQVFSGTNGQPVYDFDNTLLGYKTVISNLVPSNLVKGTTTNASGIIFGNFSDLYVGLWGGVEFIVDPYSAKKKAQIEVTANTFYDVEVARNESFAGAKDVTTAFA